MSAIALSGDGLDKAMDDAVAALRLAVMDSRKAPASQWTARAFLDDAGLALGRLRHAVELAAPLATRVAGTYYALGDPPRLRVRDGELLALRREPGNRADVNAVAIHAGCGTRVGYLPKRDAASLAPHLDAGMHAGATVACAHGTGIGIEVSGPAVRAFRLRTDEALNGIPF